MSEREREREILSKRNRRETSSLPVAELEVSVVQTTLHSTHEDTEAFLIARPQNSIPETAINNKTSQHSNQLCLNIDKVNLP